ncbi:GNAT family N-acetyltransferase [Clostridium sp. UBA4548]|uniref:GNAT family N-acetyltransferase n=1 Tax=Clostridium sp. UBA4548 TaxID=1946361 RepID=UPI0025C424D0|nr:GNAT family N-acetyltransferase [Clostridium sp. UBA4548]
MGILLKQVTKENWYECNSLEVYEEQEGIVAPNYNSIIISLLYDNWHSKCIYEDDVLIGFLLYGIEEDTGKPMLLRYMVDKKFQGKGLGKKALLKLLDLIKIEYGNIKFYTTVSPKNVSAEKLYESVGFEKNGEIMWDENVMVIQL